MNRRTRTAAAILTLVAMLFAPLAMAFTACDRAGDMEAAKAGPMQWAPMATAGTDAAMDSALCEQHCKQGKASFQPAANPPSQSPIPAIAPLRIDALQPVSLRAPSFDSPFAAAAGPAPPLIRYTVLRH